MRFVLTKILKIISEGKLVGYTIKEIDQIFARIARWFMCMLSPVQENKILFATQEDKYCCNPKYICEEFRKRNKDLDLVFTVRKGKRDDIPLDVRIVTRGSYEYYKEMFSAKYIFTNSTLYSKAPFTLKKKSQVLIETWHGSLGIKRFGRKEYKSGWHWVRGAIKTGKLTKYCVSNSVFEDGVYKETYWPNAEILRYGHPRNDVFFDNFTEERAEIRQKFLEKYEIEVEEGNEPHFILYGPTFRDSKNFDCYNIDVEALLEAVTERFGGRWIFLKRYHNSVRNVYKTRNQIKSDNCNIFDVTSYPDMQELITIADIAITDYSSWIYDFILTRKPGFIFATDVDLYNNERGFYYPLESTPFPVAKDNETLIKNIMAFDNEKYLTEVESFLDGKGCVDDGHASERVVDKVFELMGSNLHDAV